MRYFCQSCGVAAKLSFIVQVRQHVSTQFPAKFCYIRLIQLVDCNQPIGSCPETDKISLQLQQMTSRWQQAIYFSQKRVVWPIKSSELIE